MNFQYPLSDRVGWNLATREQVEDNSFDLLFQYPLSDRVGWNGILGVLSGGEGGLSVSSIGSSWVELGEFPDLEDELCQSFSILYRIELGGTELSSTCSRVAMIFQYPLSDRVGWNLH